MIAIKAQYYKYKIRKQSQWQKEECQDLQETILLISMENKHEAIRKN